MTDAIGPLTRSGLISTRTDVMHAVSSSHHDPYEPAATADFGPPGSANEARSKKPPAFTGLHVLILASLLLAATVMTFLITSSAYRDGRYQNVSVIAPTVLTITGPFTGAICRSLQSCCFEFSVSLLPWCLPPLLGAFAVQLFWRPQSRAGQACRLAIWAVGWIGWFAAGGISFVHALL